MPVITLKLAAQSCCKCPDMLSRVVSMSDANSIHISLINAIAPVMIASKCISCPNLVTPGPSTYTGVLDINVGLI